MSHVYAWAHAVASEEVIELGSRIPGLGMVLNPHNYDAAPFLPVKPVAYLNGNPKEAERVAANPDRWAFAVLSDERNVTGLSGKREEPHEYIARVEPARQILAEAGVRTSSAGLGMLGGLFGRFDHEYTSALHGWTDQAGVNLSPMQYHTAVRGIRQHEGQFFVTLIPQRMTWKPENTIISGFLHRFVVVPSLGGQFRALSRNPKVAGVGVWCLREVAFADGSTQAHHGLFDAGNRMTWQGRVLQRVLGA